MQRPRSCTSGAWSSTPAPRLSVSQLHGGRHVEAVTALAGATAAIHVPFTVDIAPVPAADGARQAFHRRSQPCSRCTPGQALQAGFPPLSLALRVQDVVMMRGKSQAELRVSG